MSENGASQRVHHVVWTSYLDKILGKNTSTGPQNIPTYILDTRNRQIQFDE